MHKKRQQGLTMSIGVIWVTWSFSDVISWWRPISGQFVQLDKSIEEFEQLELLVFNWRTKLCELFRTVRVRTTWTFSFSQLELVNSNCANSANNCNNGWRTTEAMIFLSHNSNTGWRTSRVRTTKIRTTHSRQCPGAQNCATPIRTVENSHKWTGT